ncbi:MAG: four helix bundle protein [Bacteroidetes bacterium]|nr:four helix bundle protein [Bacteroidota bacterium]
MLSINIPKEELFCLTRQLRKAAVSVPSNISEGAARNQKKEFIRFLRISSGSLSEIETQILIARRLNYIAEEKLLSTTGHINKIRAQLSGLIKYLTQNP